MLLLGQASNSHGVVWTCLLDVPGLRSGTNTSSRRETVVVEGSGRQPKGDFARKEKEYLIN